MATAAPPMPVTNRRFSEIGVAVAVVFVIALLVVPLPAILLDLFLALSIGLSLVVLLVALYTNDPLEFSSFPVLLLLLSDPDIERALRAAPPAERARAVWLPHLVASALADRDYTTALGLLERTPDEQLALADLRQYVGFVLQKQRSASAGSGDGVPALER